jgi:uncharacterized membrane protein YGL010W
MIFPPHPPAPLVLNWFERHRDPRSFILHIIGIPPTILGVLMIPIYVFLVSASLFLFALALFVGGYLIQFLGHVLDGSEPGEVRYLRLKAARKLGWSIGEIAPVPQASQAT